MIGRVLCVALLLAGCAAGLPEAPPGEVTAPGVALLGDAPYSQAHANLLDGMIDEINLAEPAFVVHLGDITGGQGPCTDAWLEARKNQFAHFAAPFVLVFGDNEWTDCHRSGFDPLERLAKVRTLFHSSTPKLAEFSRQSPERPEHARWVAGSTLYIALNVPGSNNNLGRTPQMDTEHAARMRAVLAWLDEAVTIASAPRFETLVVMMHADPDFERARNLHGQPDGYSGLRAALKRDAKRLEKPIVLVHGDTHRFRHDLPVADIANLVRIEVDGWPALGWVRLRNNLTQGDALRVQRMRYR